VLGLANRLLAADGRNKALTATRPDGPAPTVEGYQDGDVELSATMRRIKGLLAGLGSEAIEPAEIAILVRMNAQLAPIEEALTRAGIAYQVRGVRFYDRPDVVAAVGATRRLKTEATGRTLAREIRTLFRTELGHEADGPAAAAGPRGDEARERAAALETILAIVDEVVRADPASDVAAIRAELERRAAHERNGSSDGVNLLTYHRAKGLEWDAVFLPMLEDGTLPIRQAFDDEAALAEERRLLYVGITRARRHLHLSWADRRETRGRQARLRRGRGPAAEGGPRRGPPVRCAPGVANGAGARGGETGLRRCLGCNAERDRGSPPEQSRGARAGQRHRPGQARQVRPRHPGHRGSGRTGPAG